MFPLPFGDARYAPITAEDQGRVIAAILNNPAEHAGKVYPLYGPKELTQHEVADILTQVLGRKISRCRHPADVPCARRFQALNIAYARGCAMKIGIIGTVGKMLATKLAEKGRPVLVANSRSPEGVADSLAASEASLMPSSTPEARLS